jgi:hypothetical protein
MSRRKTLKNENGAALISVIMAFAVILILISSIVFVARQDVLETVKQEERLRTFYIASAGIELTYAALMDPDYDPKLLQAAINTLKNNGNTPLIDSMPIGDEGVADVSIMLVTIDEKEWLQVTSVGQLNGLTTTVSTSLRVNTTNLNQIVREKFGH